MGGRKRGEREGGVLTGGPRVSGVNLLGLELGLVETETNKDTVTHCITSL